MTFQQLRLIVPFLLLLPFMFAHAQWSSDPATNNPICQAGNIQNAVRMVSDGQGGAIVCWADEREARGFFRVYAQRIDRDGFVRWAENGIVISPTNNAQLKPEMVSDDAGGAIIAWMDMRDGSVDVYAQRIDSSGNALWKSDGVPVAIGSTDQTDPTLAGDGSHGAIIAWSAHTGTSQDGHIFAQRIDAAGKPVWSPELQLSSSDQFESTPCIASDGSGGAYIAWVFYNNQDYDVYAQRVSSGGAQHWQSGGIAFTPASGAQDTPALVADGTGKAFLTYYDYSTGSNPVLQVVVLNSDGTTAASLRLTSSSGGQANPKLANIGAGLLGIAWEDGRQAGKTRSYAQIIDNAGNKSWAADGVAVSDRTGNQATPFVVSDGNGGIIVCWEDMTGGVTESDIYAQRISGSGAPLWPSAGVQICSAGRMQQYPWMVRDGQNGAILAWVDYRSSFSNPEIFGFRILADGTYPIGPPILKLSERAVTFGVVDIGRIRTENITLRNTGGSPVTIASITSSDPHFSLTPDNSTIPPNSSISAVLRFQPTTKDVLSASIVIESNSIFGPDTIFVTGAGSGSAAIEIDRTALNFGEVNMGSSRALAMNVSNPGNDTLRITSVTTSNPRFTVDITTKVLAPGEAFEDTVRFTPTDAGPVSATLALTSNAPDSPTILQLTGTGKVVVVIEVTMTIDPAEITFGEVTVGLQKDTTVTVTNTGNDTLRISEFASDDPRFTLLTALTDIAPTESQTLTLRFAPDAVGPFSSVFLVTSNAVTSPDTIAVQGTGREVTAVRALQVFPGAFTLYPNYPNPFHPATTIRYDLETSAPVSVTVLNRLGQVTSVLVDEMQSPGLHAVQWTPTSVAPGVYFYVLRVGAYKAYGRMVLMP
jgi:hypothetical protein